MSVVYDEASGFWIGKPWIVIDQEGEPGIALETLKEALNYIEEQEE